MKYSRKSYRKKASFRRKRTFKKKSRKVGKLAGGRNRITK